MANSGVDAPVAVINLGPSPTAVPVSLSGVTVVGFERYTLTAYPDPTDMQVSLPCPFPRLSLPRTLSFSSLFFCSTRELVSTHLANTATSLSGSMRLNIIEKGHSAARGLCKFIVEGSAVVAVERNRTERQAAGLARVGGAAMAARPPGDPFSMLGWRICLAE